MRQQHSYLAVSGRSSAARLAGLALAGLFAAAPGPAQAAEGAVAIFRDTCAACHTVGGGESAGPDLVSAASMDRATLRENVVRMQDYAGELTDSQIDGLIDLLSDPQAADRIGGPAEVAVPDDEAGSSGEEAGDPKRGAALFMGRTALTHGGLPCAACHRASGESGPSAGGTLAKSLVGAGERLGVRGLTAAAENAAFPLMRGAYRGRPVTHEEALDLAAYLTAEEPSGLPDESAATGGRTDAGELPLGAWAAGLALVCLAVIGLTYRRRGLRPAGPRRRLLTQAEERRTIADAPVGAREGSR